MDLNQRPDDMVRITTPELAQAFIDEQVAAIREQIGDKKVLLALSGGVDSSVVAALLIKAIGKQLICVHVNNGLMRKGESEQVFDVFKNQMDANLVYVDATDRFLGKLVDVAEPEAKRKIIDAEFIRVLLATGTHWMPPQVDVGSILATLASTAISAVRSGLRTRGGLCSLIGQFVTMRVDEVEHDAGSHHADVQTVENQGVRQRVVHKLRDNAKDIADEANQQEPEADALRGLATDRFDDVHRPRDAKADQEEHLEEARIEQFHFSSSIYMRTWSSFSCDQLQTRLSKTEKPSLLDDRRSGKVLVSCKAHHGDAQCLELRRILAKLLKQLLLMTGCHTFDHLHDVFLARLDAVMASPRIEGKTLVDHVACLQGRHALVLFERDLLIDEHCRKSRPLRLGLRLSLGADTQCGLLVDRGVDITANAHCKLHRRHRALVALELLRLCARRISQAYLDRLVRTKGCIGNVGLNLSAVLCFHHRFLSLTGQTPNQALPSSAFTVCV